LSEAVPFPERHQIRQHLTGMLQIGQTVDHRNGAVAREGFHIGMFSRAEDVANRAIITPLAENEPVLEGKLAPKESGAGLSATIPEGMRALSVAVNEVVGVAGFVIPGTMVDVLVTGRVMGKDAAQGDITRTILENVRVLAAGQKVEQDREGKPQTVAVITLLVTPDDASKLTLAAADGRIQLSLRNTVDTKKNDPATIQQADLFTSSGAKLTITFTFNGPVACSRSTGGSSLNSSCSAA